MPYAVPAGLNIHVSSVLLNACVLRLICSSGSLNSFGVFFVHAEKSNPIESKSEIFTILICLKFILIIP